MSAPKRKKPSSPEQESKLPEMLVKKVGTVDKNSFSRIFRTSDFEFTPVADKVDIGFAMMNKNFAELKECICDLRRGDDRNSSFDLQREINSNVELQSRINELKRKIADLESECETSRQLIIDQGLYSVAPST